MDISKIDKNFALTPVTEKDIEWIPASDSRFSLYGVYYENGEYVRMPGDIARATNEGVAKLYKHTAGGRLRFKTDSSYVALKAVIPKPNVMRNMPLTGSAGFSIYVDGKYETTAIPDFSVFSKIPGETAAIQAITYCNGDALHSVEMYFPLYNGAFELYVGVKCGSNISPAVYEREGRVIYYGSSITQGGCASRPGNDYEAYISRKLDIDYLNLGFSGSARAEDAMCEYIASLDARIFVIDYDHNAPSALHLEKTHYKLYKTVREKHRNAPIIFISKPDFKNNKDSVDRRNVIISTYERALAEADKNVYFIDGETLFAGECKDACTVDSVHPNDLGFFRMANVICPVIESALK